MAGSGLERESASDEDKLEVANGVMVDRSSGLEGNRTEQGQDAGTIVDSTDLMACG